MKLSIIIPVYNEQVLVTEVINKILAVQLPAFLEGFEIIIVDDCSTDNSYQALTDYLMNKDQKNMLLLKHDVNKGKGAAVRTGISRAKGDTILIQDADLELVPNDIPSMLIAMKELGVEFVNGSRYMPGIIRPLYAYRRYYFNKFFTRLASVLVNVRFTDLACGYKLFTRSLYEKISLHENRFGFEAELIIKVARIKRTLIAEVPVNYFPRNIGEGKKIRNIDGLRILKTIFKYGLLRMS